MGTEGERGEVFYAKEAAREDQKKSRAWELGVGLNMLSKSEKAYGGREERRACAHVFAVDTS